MDRGYNFSLGSADNGNVMSITNYRDSSRTQTFTYDNLNRITSGWSTADTGTLSWGENYAVDPWGNLMTSPMLNKVHGGNFQCAGDPQNHATCLSYDAAGNVIVNSPASYVYDQENRIASTAGMTYVYDANGNRVEKTGGGSGTLYWYGAPGILAESDLAGNLKSEYVFFGGKRVARIDSPGNSVHYYLSDHLNSTTMVVSSTGIPEEESDYSPFGTEYPVISSGANHYKFTGKERDAETCAAGSCLDYFGARYYGSTMGRWLSPDWSAMPTPIPYAKLSNPQSLNLYAYVLNNPLRAIDKDGHCDSSKKATANTKCQEIKDLHVNDAMKDKLKESEGEAGGKPMLVVKDIGDGHHTVGWGHKDDSMKLGDKITKQKAQELFDKDLSAKESEVKNILTNNGDHQFSQGEFNALVDLAYNGGSGLLSTDKSPKLMKAMNAGDYKAMSGQLRYTMNDRGETMPGLATRSDDRKSIFLGEDPK